MPAEAVFDGPKSKEPLCRQASFKGTLDAMDWRLDYRVIGLGLINKTLTLTPKRDLVLKQVCMWEGLSETPPVVSSTSLQDIAAFYRQTDRGMFVSLHFPYSKIVAAGGAATVTYPPYDALKTGQPYTCHSLTVGATVLTG